MAEVLTEQPAAADSAPELSIEERFTRKLFPNDAPEKDVEETAPTESAEVEAAEQPEPESTDSKEPDSEEVEWQGQKYLVPKELKSALMANADYTRKTQEVASIRSSLQAEREAFAMQQAVQQTVAPELQRLSTIDAQIAQIANQDWASMDTDTLVKSKHNLDVLKEHRENLANQISGKVNEYQEQIRGKLNESMQKGVEWLAKEIPNYSPAIAKSLIEYAPNEGYSKEEVLQVTDPRMIKTLWKAQQWDNLQKSKGQIADKKLPRVTPVLKPGTPQGRSPGDMEIAEHRKGIRQAKTDQQKAVHIQAILERRLFK